MQVNPYVAFNGDCEAAFTFYEQHLGGKIGTLFRYAGTPFAADAPPGWDNKVMHGSVTLGDLVLMGADVVPDKYEQPKGFSFLLHLKTAAEADAVIEALATDGRIVVQPEKTFWADRFAVVIDRFGVQWTINGGEGGSS